MDIGDVDRFPAIFIKNLWLFPWNVWISGFSQTGHENKRFFQLLLKQNSPYQTCITWYDSRCCDGGFCNWDGWTVFVFCLHQISFWVVSCDWLCFPLSTCWYHRPCHGYVSYYCIYVTTNMTTFFFRDYNAEKDAQSQNCFSARCHFRWLSLLLRLKSQLWIKKSEQSFIFHLFYIFTVALILVHT